MIKEYAVDPEAVFRNEDSLMRFLSDFNADKGRVIAKLPFNWYKSFERSVQKMKLKTKARRHCYDTLKNIETTSVIENTVERKQNDNWLDDALFIQNETSLDSIITTKEDIQSRIFDYSNFLESRPEKWEIEQTHFVERKALPLAESIEASLKIAKRIHFVDRYFYPSEERYFLPFIEFINKIVQGRFPPKKIYLIVSNTEEQSLSFDLFRDNFIKGFNANISPNLPKGFQVEVRVWPFKDLHDRYVITNNVGYAFGHGLDESNYQKSKYVEVHRLSENSRKSHSKELSKEAYCVIPIFTLSGE
jgi:hypothetical protein